MVSKHLTLTAIRQFNPNRDLDDHVAFGRWFGPLEQHPHLGNAYLQHPEVFELAASKGGIADEWHTDLTFLEQPSVLSILNMVRCADAGGDTMWSNMVLAYEGLPRTIKDQIEGLIASHSIQSTFGAALPIEKRLAMKATYPDAEHPVVWVHPATGRKCLYVSEGYTTRIVGMPEEEGRALLQELTAHCTRPEFTYRHAWRDHDLVVWDNLATMHRSTPFEDQKYRRELRRILRLLLVPFFVVEVLYYVKTEEEVHRVAALLTFMPAAPAQGAA